MTSNDSIGCIAVQQSTTISMLARWEKLHMGKMIELTVVRRWKPDFDSEGYKQVEWPADSGEYKDLTTIEDIVAYEQHLYESGDSSVEDILDIDDPDNFEVTWKVVDDTPDQVMDPTQVPNYGEANPFLTDDQLDKVADGVKDGLEADRAAAEASGVVAENAERTGPTFM